MYILIDKIDKKIYCSRDKNAISKSSGISENTLKWYLKHGEYHENAKHIFCKTELLIGKKGGTRIKNNYL